VLSFENSITCVSMHGQVKKAPHEVFDYLKGVAKLYHDIVWSWEISLK